MMKGHSSGLRFALAAGFLLLAGNVFAASSPWVEATDSKLRLIAGGEDEDGAIRTGIEIRMEPGWKTYWRTPGDTGVPPSFDWSGSENLKSAEILYPAPSNLMDAGGQAYGYKDEVVFPVKITPDREGKPVILKLSMEFGLCKDICIPNRAELTLKIPAEPAPAASDSLMIDRYLAWVPKPAEQGSLPALVGIERHFEKSEPQLLVDVRFPEDAERTDLFIEAGDEYVPPAIAEGEGKDGARRFIVTFREKSEVEDIMGKTLILTMVGDRGARETRRKLE